VRHLLDALELRKVSSRLAKPQSWATPAQMDALADLVGFGNPTAELIVEAVLGPEGLAVEEEHPGEQICGEGLGAGDAKVAVGLVEPENDLIFRARRPGRAPVACEGLKGAIIRVTPQAAAR
jgi:hypothetical protein